MTAEFLSFLTDTLPLDPDDRIDVIDVGASNVDPSERPLYDPHLTAGLARLTGFEPNPEQFAKLPQTDQRQYLQMAIGDGADQTLYLTVHPGFASVLTPNPPVARSIATSKLDDVAEIERMDMLKIDIHGGECLAFAGAQNRLADCLCVRTETAFVPLDKDPPLFGDQHKMLAEAGLMCLGFHKVTQHPLHGRFRKRSGAAKSKDIGAWVDADAVFIRDVQHWDRLADDAPMRLFLILAVAYDAPSAAMHAAVVLEQGECVDAGFVSTCVSHFHC